MSRRPGQSPAATRRAETVSSTISSCRMARRRSEVARRSRCPAAVDSWPASSSSSTWAACVTMSETRRSKGSSRATARTAAGAGRDRSTRTSRRWRPRSSRAADAIRPEVRSATRTSSSGTRVPASSRPVSSCSATAARAMPASHATTRFRSRPAGRRWSSSSCAHPAGSPAPDVRCRPPSCRPATSAFSSSRPVPGPGSGRYLMAPRTGPLRRRRRGRAGACRAERASGHKLGEWRSTSTCTPTTPSRAASPRSPTASAPAR